MSTDTFNIRVQIGIAGGFAPTTPNAIYGLSRPLNSDILTVVTQKRPHCTPSLLPPQTKELKVADYIEETGKLLQLLRDLPTQYPGAEDLYGRNTSIVLVVKPGDYVPTGSFAGSGIPPPTEEQRAQFDEAIAIVEKLVTA